MPQSSDETATLASKVLKDPKSSFRDKELAGSVLSQSSTDRQTTARMATLASEILKSSSSELSKTLAGSVLSQRAK